jgi:hypothetical protein
VTRSSTGSLQTDLAPLHDRQGSARGQREFGPATWMGFSKLHCSRATSFQDMRYLLVYVKTLLFPLQRRHFHHDSMLLVCRSTSAACRTTWNFQKHCCFNTRRGTRGQGITKRHGKKGHKKIEERCSLPSCSGADIYCRISGTQRSYQTLCLTAALLAEETSSTKNLSTSH